MASTHLKDDEREVYNATDLNRLDGRRDHVCCSVEYPNGWYFRRAQSKESLFRDWVVLFLRPDLLWAPGTLFCPRNAAAGRGAGVQPGFSAYAAMYAATVSGQSGRTFQRSLHQLPSSPTDDQAEVLIPDQVSVDSILGVGVRDVEQAKRLSLRLRLAQLDVGAPPIVIVPLLYEPKELSKAIREGRQPEETPWKP